MKTLLITAFALVLFSCNKPKEYISNLTQTGTNDPTTENVVDKLHSFAWKRNDIGIYQADFDQSKSGEIISFIDQSSDLNVKIRIYTNSEYIQIYTQRWSDEQQIWEFSDDVLNNTSVRISYYK